METSTYQSLKLQIVDLVGLSKDAIHIHIGLLVFLAAVLFWQKGKINFKCLVPVLLIASGMEVIDLYDDYNLAGFMRWSNSAHDIVNTSIWPLLTVVIYNLKNTRDDYK